MYAGYLDFLGIFPKGIGNRPFFNGFRQKTGVFERNSVSLFERNP